MNNDQDQWQKPLTMLTIRGSGNQWTLTEDFNGESQVIHRGGYDQVMQRGHSMVTKTLPAVLVLSNEFGDQQVLRDYSRRGI